MQAIGAIKNRTIVGSLTAAFIILGVSSASPATANALDLGSGELNVPLGSVGEPVADLLNPITEVLPVPVTVNSNPNKLGADVDVPLLSDTSDSTPALSANLTVPDVVPDLTEPLSQVTDPLLQPVADTVAPITQPLANTLRPLTQPDLNLPTTPRSQLPVIGPPKPTGTLVVQKGPSIDNKSLAVSGPVVSTPDRSRFLLDSLSNFLTSTLPGAFSGLLGKNISAIPIAISAILLLLVMTALGTIVYKSRYGGTVVIGRYNLTKLAQAHDLAQLATFGVAVTGLGIVTIILSLALL